MAVETQPRPSSPVGEGTEPRARRALLGPMSGRELAGAWALLALVGFLAFLPHILDGGLYMDDWADAAGGLYPTTGTGFFGAVEWYNAMLSSCRPVLILFFPLKYLLLGTNVTLLLALCVALAVSVACLGYAVLRNVGLPWYHAGLIAALTLVYPWFDSIRFWEAASPISLALAFALAGLWVALAGLTRRSWRLHVGAAVLYLLSMLTYELTLPLIACAGFLYLYRAGWRVARGRWALDLVMVVVAGAWASTHTPREVTTFSENIDHLGEIVTQGGELLGRTLFALGPEPQTTISLLTLALAAVAGAAVFLLARRPSEPGWGLRNWLILFAVGVLIAALGWATFIPADPYYTPTIYGISNRVNGIAGLGLILTVYSAFGIVGSLAGRVTGRKTVAIAVTLCLGIALGATYLRVLERHSDLWVDAYERGQDATATIASRFPSPPPETTIYASGYPAFEVLGVPVFTTAWDLSGRVILLYEDNTLRAFPSTPELRPTCEPAGMGLEGEQGIDLTPYGKARLIDLHSGRVAIPRDRKQCLAAVPTFPVGPTVARPGY